MAGLVFLLVFWVLAGACERHVGVGGFLLQNSSSFLLLPLFISFLFLFFFVFFCSMNTNGHREKNTSGGRLSFGRLAGTDMAMMMNQSQTRPPCRCRAGTFPVSFPAGGGWEMNSFWRAVNCGSRVSAKAFWGPFLAKPVFLAGGMGFCGATPVFLRVPRGFNWRALELFPGGGMSKTGSSRSA